MYLTINNKSLLECNKDDLQILLNNPDYREGQYLEYKKAFAFQEVDKEKKTEALTEFRNDICAFASAEGGYILYGVVEKEGVASEIVGVIIQNRDIRLQPWLVSIQIVKNAFDLFDLMNGVSGTKRELKHYSSTIKRGLP